VPADAGLVVGVRTPLQRIIEAIPLVSDAGALTGWAAAYLAAVTSLDGRDARTMREIPVPLYLGVDVGRTRRKDWLFLRHELPRTDVRVVRLRVHDTFLGEDVVLQLPAAAPPRAAFDGVRMTADLAEAVAFIDACANAGWVDLEDLATYVETRAGARGIVFMRRVLDLADAAARSPWESRLRVFFVTVADLPRPQVNVPVFDVDERLLGIADLLEEDAGLVTEFDGQDHRERRQHRDDNDREEYFEDANLVVVRADSLDLTDHQHRLRDRLRSGYRRGMQRDRRKDRWTTRPPDWWLAEHGDVALSNEEKADLHGD
jgi:hypothetical protein